MAFQFSHYWPGVSWEAILNVDESWELGGGMRNNREKRRALRTRMCEPIRISVSTELELGWLIIPKIALSMGARVYSDFWAIVMGHYRSIFSPTDSWPQPLLAENITLTWGRTILQRIKGSPSPARCSIRGSSWEGSRIGSVSSTWSEDNDNDNHGIPRKVLPASGVYKKRNHIVSFDRRCIVNPDLDLKMFVSQKSWQVKSELDAISHLGRTPCMKRRSWVNC